MNEVIQVAMGWTNSHLHQFVIDNTYYGIPASEYEDPDAMRDERLHTLAQTVKNTGDKFSYQYDFGNNWQHSIVVESIRPSKTPSLPNCLAGERHGPPDGVGDWAGYENFLDAIKDPKHPKHDELLEWAGGSFYPEAFDVGITNQTLKKLRKAGSLEVLWLERDNW
jgi:hypothetical protein